MNRVHLISLQAAKRANRTLFTALKAEMAVILYFPSKLKTYGSQVQFSDAAGANQKCFSLLLDDSFFYFSLDLLMELSRNVKKNDVLILDFDIGTLLSLVIRFLYYKNKIIHIQIDHKSRALSRSIIKSLRIKDLMRILLRRAFMAPILKKPRVLACNYSAVSDFRRLDYEAEFCPLGFDDALFYCPDEKPTSNNLLRIGYFSRFKSEKGISDLLEALAMVDCSNFELVLDHSMSEYPLVYDEILAVTGVAKLKIRFYEFEEIPKALASLDYLIMPSRETTEFSEQYGRLVVEAQAVGTPVISSDSGMLRYLNLNSNLIYKANCKSELASLLSGLPLRSAIVGQELSEQNFLAYSTQTQALTVSKAIDES